MSERVDEQNLIMRILDWGWAVVIALCVSIWGMLTRKMDMHLVEDTHVHERIFDKLDETNQAIGNTNQALAETNAKLGEVVGELRAMNKGIK